LARKSDGSGERADRVLSSALASLCISDAPCSRRCCPDISRCHVCQPVRRRAIYPPVPWTGPGLCAGEKGGQRKYLGPKKLLNLY